VSNVIPSLRFKNKQIFLTNHLNHYLSKQKVLRCCVSI